MNYSPHNTASTFTTKLNETVELDGSWEVGLLEITMPKSVQNVTDDSYYYSVFMLDGTPTRRVTLKRGSYVLQRDLISEIMSAQRRVFGLQGNDWLINFRTVSASKRVALKIRPNAVNVSGVKFSESLGNMLGFDWTQTYSGNSEHRSPRATDMAGNVQMAYVYCDVLEQVIVGDTKAPLLRIVNRAPSNHVFDGADHVTFNPVQYIPLQKKCFGTITIKLMTDEGTPVPFFPGKSIAVLEFRRSAHPYLLV